MPVAIPQQHHHRSTTKNSHKAYKPRYTSKNALRNQAKGRVDHLEKGIRRDRHHQAMSKVERRNQAKQRRLAHNHDQAKVKSVFSGKNGAPRIVAVVPLCDDVDSNTAVKSLNASLNIEQSSDSISGIHTHVERFKQNVCYLPMKRDLLQCMNACRIADFVMFVFSPHQEVDELGELLLRTIEGQGISTVYTVIQGLESIASHKQRTQILESVKSYILHFFPDQHKIHSIDSFQDSQNFVRSLCSTMPKGVRWREDRSWLLVEEIKWISSEGAKQASHAHPDFSDVLLTGVVRGKGLKADRLAHVNDWGDFQIHSIIAAPRHVANGIRGESMMVDSDGSGELLQKPSEDQETLDLLAPEEVLMEDLPISTMASSKKGVLVDDEHYYSDPDEDNDLERPKRLPKGTSKYQSAWYLDDVSDSGSDIEELERNEGKPDIDGPIDPADGSMGSSYQPLHEATEVGPSEYPESEMFSDRSLEEEAQDIAAHRANRKLEAEENRQFPDEVELHPNVLARERLAKYRGLKSLRTSTWSTDEDKLYEPNEWRRLLDVSDYKGARNKMISEALAGGVEPGTRVQVRLKNVPSSFQDTSTMPLTMFSLLRHEHKHTAVNCSLTLKSDYSSAIKSKDELIVQCGPRRLVINPLFSQVGNTPNDVHKFERFVNPGQTVVASFTGPLTWGAVPLLYFRKRQENLEATDPDAMDTSTSSLPNLELVGHGTLLPVSTNRIIAKRIVLTGEPYKIHKKLVTVRYMFFNAEDVAWFKALQLWTNKGRQGNIKESLGTHGYFKAVFDGRAGLQDAIGISLYKRVWPRPARPFTLN